KKYLMNPTTLKRVFKEVYGMSIAAHMKQHRMEEAAKLLKKSGMSIAQIAKNVGYESQSRFTTAFKDYYGMLPTEYRKNNTL
ncbi:TPA: helix-turn-helix transcriptional regulator, partial [Streptococcus agalactiae]|nr:helix-turn-helix transcriptional regulator [Streptococcus agalactiae]